MEHHFQCEILFAFLLIFQTAPQSGRVEDKKQKIYLLQVLSVLIKMKEIKDTMRIESLFCKIDNIWITQ